MMDTNNLVLLLNELDDDGLLRCVRDPADRRRHLVQVTEEGLARDLHRLLATALGKD